MPQRLKTIFYLALLSRVSIVEPTDSLSREPFAQQHRIGNIENSGPRRLVEASPSNANRAFGEKTLLVVRIEAQDSSTTATEEQLFDDIFGSEVTFTNQINVCSHGKLTINPATGNNINSGISTVKMNNVVGRSTISIIEEIDKESVSLFGRELNEFNHVMFCMPSGTTFINAKKGSTGKWHAFVPGDWRYTNFVSVFNDKWCSSISAGMHEIGHNLGLEHSNESGSLYDDETGSMGYSGMKENFGAKRCYNPSKSWQLGWYSEHSKRIDPFIEAPFQTILTGITRPPLDGDPYKNILLQIPNGQTNFYIGYNLAEDFNSGTLEGRNQVLINEKEPGLRTNSNLLKKMGRGDSYKIKNYQESGENLVIQVDRNFWNGKEALLKVFFESDDVFKKAGCDDDQVRFEVSVKTDNYAKDTSWVLVNDGTGAIVASQSSDKFYGMMNHDYSICIDRERDFTFTFYDEYEDGICCKQGWGEYSVFLDGKEIFHGGEFQSSSVDHSFRTKEQETDASCRDDPFFRYKRLRKCSWVEHERKDRCSKIWLGKPVYRHCPATCGLCAPYLELPNLDKVSPDKIERNSLGHNIFCHDDSKYRIRGKYSCDWVAKDTATRCNKTWRGTYAKEHCQATCNFCGHNQTNAKLGLT